MLYHKLHDSVYKSVQHCIGSKNLINSLVSKTNKEIAPGRLHRGLKTETWVLPFRTLLMRSCLYAVNNNATKTERINLQSVFFCKGYLVNSTEVPKPLFQPIVRSNKSSCSLFPRPSTKGSNSQFRLYTGFVCSKLKPKRYTF